MNVRHWGVALCAMAFAASAWAAELRVLSWSSYLSPEVVERYEKETGVTVRVDTVTGYAELMRPLESGASGYDVAIPADFQLRQLIDRGLVERVAVDRLSNFWNVEDLWRSRALDPRNEYAVPHAWGTTAFVVDTAVFPGDPDTLDLLFAPPPEIAGRIVLLDSGYDMVQLTLVWLKLPRCSTRPEHLARVEQVLTPMLRRYPLATIDTVIDTLASGQYALGVAWSGDALKARQKRPSLRYATPREGSLVWTDVLVVPKGAPNRAAALKFLSFMMRPEIAALESNYNGYANMVRGAEATMDPRMTAAPEIVTPLASSQDFFNYCDNGAEAQQEAFWKGLRQRLDK